MADDLHDELSAQGNHRVWRCDGEKERTGLCESGGASLVAVMRRNGPAAADYARRHGVRRWYDDAAKLIHDPEGFVSP